VRTDLPTGTVTFLFSDIEGSTRLLQALGSGYQPVLERHAVLVREALAAGEGTEVATEGDSFFAVFRSAPKAVESAVAIQRALAAEPWPEHHSVLVRVGIHTGEGHLGGDSYVGIDVHRAARIAAAGHGGQVLVSATTHQLVEGSLPDNVEFEYLGTHRLKDLEHPEQLWQLVIPGLEREFPPVKTLDAPLRLPVDLSSFIGRDQQLGEVVRLLGATRLLTLFGPGGTGKTRLAIQTGRGCAAQFSDGVFFVDLAPLGDPELVRPTIARTIGLVEQADRPIADLLVEHLRDREALLILDNFEQLLPAADDVAEMLAAASRVKILITSRTVLNLLGEQTYEVPPLALPAAAHASDIDDLARNEAVALFLERARAAMPRFALTPTIARAVAEICIRLDGLPLAIELAASRVRVLEPAELLRRLSEHGSLQGEGARNLPARQRTLRSTIDWSYQLLDPSHRALFARVAIFESGCTMPAVEAVCNPEDELGMDTVDGMATLVDNSLVRRLDEDGASRFRMLETIREFGRDAMEADGSLPLVIARHLVYYRDLAERAVAGHGFLGTEQGAWLDRFEREHDNIRAALQRALDAGSNDGLRLAGAMWRFWLQRGYLREGRAWLERFLALEPASASPARARALSALGGLAYWLSDTDATERSYEAAVEMWRQLGDPNGEVEALYDRAYIPVMQFDNREGRRRFAEVLDKAQELNRTDLVSQAQSSLGVLLAQDGELDQALQLLTTSLASSRASGERFQQTWTLAQLSQIEGWLGRHAEARDHLLESLAINLEANNLPGIGANLYAIGAAEALQDRLRSALRVIGAAKALTTRTGAFAPPMFTGSAEAERKAREILGEEVAGHELAAGEAMTLEEALEYVRKLPV
jgi:predicted ATPase/class 3 adenylate cyclase